MESDINIRFRLAVAKSIASIMLGSVLASAHSACRRQAYIAAGCQPYCGRKNGALSGGARRHGIMELPGKSGRGESG